jgi:hypothetical protein
VPEGSFVNPTSMAGSKVGFVQRSTHIYAFSPGLITSINDKESSGITPNKFSLSQNYPNPFNPTTKIKFTIPKNVNGELSNVQIKIYDILGNEIITLVDKQKSPGTYEVKFDGSKLSSGVYFYKLSTGNFTNTKKMLLMK